jgi:hypothetical protein
MRAVRLVVRLARERSKNKWNMRKFVVNNIFLYFQERYGRDIMKTLDGMEICVTKAFRVTWSGYRSDTLKAMLIEALREMRWAEKNCDIKLNADGIVDVEFYEMRERKQINVDEINTIDDLWDVIRDDQGREDDDRVFSYKRNEDYAKFKDVACRACGISQHKKRDKIFGYAYECGHSAGYSEVVTYLHDIVTELFDDEVDKR